VIYVRGQDAAVAQFVAKILSPGRARTFGPCVAIGITDDDNQPIGGLVYSNYDRDAGVIEYSAAAVPGARIFSRETILRSFTFPLVHLGCHMVCSNIRADNERSLRVAAGLGYGFVTLPRAYGRDVDGVRATLTIEDWRDHKLHQRCRRGAETDNRKAA